MARCAAARRAARPLHLAAFLLCLAATACAQEIKLVSGPGCADIVPSPPTRLRAVVGDGQVTLTFAPPANGGCVASYDITVMAVDAATGRAAETQPRQRTKEFNVTISQLQNGITYRFFVRAVGSRPGGEAQVVATPLASCDPTGRPSAPTNLKATPGELSMGLCWEAPKANVCVDVYNVAVRTVQQDGQRSSPSFTRYNKGGCVTINQLAAGQLYEFSVQAWSNATRSGAFASVRATPLAPPKQWRCLPGGGNSYPLCSSASQGLCAPLTCQQQLAKGQCSAPFMRIIDRASLTVIQHCSELCGCNSDPNFGASATAGAGAGASRAAPASTPSSTPVPATSPAGAPAQPSVTAANGQAEPRVVRFDGTIEEAAAMRSAQTTSAGAWASPSGCCANPPRARAFSGFTDDEIADGA